MTLRTATYTDTWAGDLAAYLKPQRTTRGGQRITVYRWLDERGFCCDGLRCGFAAERMIAIATRDPRFANVVRAA